MECSNTGQMEGHAAIAVSATVPASVPFISQSLQWCPAVHAGNADNISEGGCMLTKTTKTPSTLTA
jgi:hypothetical protein